jgi:hypothetical protein
VADALEQDGAKKLVLGFNFNDNAPLDTVLLSPFQLDTESGVVVLSNLHPLKHIKWPQGCTHIALQSERARIDFGSGYSEVAVSAEVTVSKQQPSTDLVLGVLPASTQQDIDLFVLKLSFFQLVNGELYPFNNGAFNSMAVIGIK